MALPPKERACVLLKDVFDDTLEEIAELVDSTVGGVKAALSRGRLKLASPPAESAPPRAASADLSRLLSLYVERFNQRDWDGLRELISADARLQDKATVAPPKGREREFATYGTSFLVLALHQMIHRSHVTDARRAARIAA